MDAIVYDKVGKEAEKVRDALYGIYPQETITEAAVASFDDGADNIPVKALTVGIEPVQDLHGYDHPWPAGGGKNLLVTTLENLKSVNTNGTWNGNVYTRNGMTFSVQVDDGGNVTGVNLSGTATDSATLDTGRNVTILPAGTYTLSGGSITNVNYTLFKIVNGSATSLGGITNFTLDEETSVFVRLAAVVGSATGGTAKLQIESGSTVTDFAQYSNICPISGWTGAEIQQTGKNLFGGVYNVFFPLHFNVDTQVTASADTKGGSGNTQIAFYDSNQSRIDYWGLDTEGARDKKTFTYPATAYYVKFIRTESTNYQIELGSTATVYAPYTGKQISVTFPTEAGTIYGGTLTLNPDRTGTLVVDRASADLGAMTWSNNGDYWYNLSLVSVMKMNGYSEYSPIISEKYKTSYPSRIISKAKTNIIANYTAALGGVMVYTGDNTTAPSGQLVYELVSPQTYQLTAEQVSGILTTLYGQNNIWADTGNIEKLTYRADLGKYIDSHITTAVANALNA